MRNVACLPLLPVAWFIFIFSGCMAHSQIAAIEISQEKAPDPYSWDFGIVKEGAIVKHEFIFNNEGTHNLNIRDITTSCGCTVSKASKTELLPGEGTSIKVVFKSKGYSGKVQQFVYVHTDNVDKPVTRFIIKAEVVR
jgi:hypothetical protein